MGKGVGSFSDTHLCLRLRLCLHRSKLHLLLVLLPLPVPLLALLRPLLRPGLPPPAAVPLLLLLPKLLLLLLLLRRRLPWMLCLLLLLLPLPQQPRRQWLRQQHSLHSQTRIASKTNAANHLFSTSACEYMGQNQSFEHTRNPHQLRQPPWTLDPPAPAAARHGEGAAQQCQRPPPPPAAA